MFHRIKSVNAMPDCRLCVQFAGGAKAAGHLTVGKNAIVTAKAGVTKSVPAGKTVAGFPAIDIDLWRRQMVELRVMAKKKLK